MEKMKDLCISAKNKVVTGFSKATEHCKKHSNEYILGELQW